MTRRVPKWVWPLAQLAVAAALLALLWSAADGPAAARRLANADWLWLVLAVVALTVQTILSALRWRLTAQQLGLSFGSGHAIREYYLAQVVNQSLPGGMIGDAGRAYRARKQAGLLASGQAVVIERLVGQIAMFLTLAVAFCATSLVPGGLEWPRWLALPVSGFVLAGLILPLLLWAATRVQGVTGRGAVSIWTALQKALGNRKVLPGQITLSIGTTLCNLAAFAFCAQAVGVALSISAIAALVPLILFTMLIPISVSGWGLREGAAAALLPLAGATASSGLASSVAFGLSFIVAVLPGLIFLKLKPRAAGIKL
ncbi:MAG: lysylphosphatidylglycerol synthase transmembrane domain-containing protein [Pseudomonadota bacterium]